ncbi:RNA methyltransferase [Nocardioides sp. S-58]|uniref:RNA methyltransferase n=1 Tax=Nocardioides renjunii TaxID=3095075 RepID=A0ABU5KGA9_9ACTN|nr:RNA methyltransferase [Nocardioides sp. S-58]MDZ5663489.1 RNA methyltransferase [Nocardioides sp. S-58]
MADLVDITDPDDPRLADYRDLRDVELRKSLEAEHGLFLAEGEKVVRRALEAGHEARSFLMAPRWLDGLADVLVGSAGTCFVMPEPLIEQVTGFHVHRGALASLHRRPLPTVEEVLAGARSVLVLEDLVDHTNVGRTELHPKRVRIAVLEDLVDHANVGAAFRSAAALGVDGVLLSPRCADPLYRRAIKVSMGAVLQVPWTRVEPWPTGLLALKEQGFVIAGMTLADDSIDFDDLAAMDHPKLALVFGTEGAGLSRRAAQLVDYRVRIPMDAGVDSLNVAAASAVAFYSTRPRQQPRSIEQFADGDLESDRESADVDE